MPKAFDFLPEVHKTEPNRRLFEGAVEHLFAKSELEKVQGIVGKGAGQFRVVDPVGRNQLEPAVVVRNPVDNSVETVIFYADMVRLLAADGALVGNEDRLWQTDSYVWVPPINLDMFVNYQDYYWYPPEEVGGEDLLPYAEISGTSVEVEWDVRNEEDEFVSIAEPINHELDATATTAGTFLNSLNEIFRLPELDNAFENPATRKNIARFRIDGIELLDGMTFDFNKAYGAVKDSRYRCILTNMRERPEFITIGGKRSTYDTVGETREVVKKYAVYERSSGPWSDANNWYHKDALLASIGQNAFGFIQRKIYHPWNATDKVPRPMEEIVFPSTNSGYDITWNGKILVVDNENIPTTKTVNLLDSVIAINHQFTIQNKVEGVHQDVNNITVTLQTDDDVVIKQGEARTFYKEDGVWKVIKHVHKWNTGRWNATNKKIATEFALDIKRKADRPIIQFDRKMRIARGNVPEVDLVPEFEMHGANGQPMVDEDGEPITSKVFGYEKDEEIAEVAADEANFVDYVSKDFGGEGYYSDGPDLFTREDSYSNNYHKTDRIHQFAFGRFEITAGQREFALTIPVDEKNKVRVIVDGSEWMDGWSYAAGVVTFATPPVIGSVVEIGVRTEKAELPDNMYWDLPVGLEANAVNASIASTISRKKTTENPNPTAGLTLARLSGHFSDVIANQDYLDGEITYNETEQQPNVGRRVLQHDTPMLLPGYLLARSDRVGIIPAIRKGVNNYVQLRGMILQEAKKTEFRNTDELDQLLDRIRARNFISADNNEYMKPVTPAAVGLAEMVAPQAYLAGGDGMPVDLSADDVDIDAKYDVKCHDGSLVRNLELDEAWFAEKFELQHVWNTFSVNERNTIRNARQKLGYEKVLPGFERKTEWTWAEAHRIMFPAFQNWLVQNRSKYDLENWHRNTGFVEGDRSTWNYSSVTLSDGVKAPGHVEGIKRYWDNFDPESDADVQSLDPPSETERKKDWVFGDGSPTEQAFWESSYGKAALAELVFLAMPAKFINYGWDTVGFQEAHGQTVYRGDGNWRINPDAMAENALIGNKYYYGWQPLIKSYMENANLDYKRDFVDGLAVADVNLALHAGGFVDSGSLHTETVKAIGEYGTAVAVRNEVAETERVFWMWQDVRTDIEFPNTAGIEVENEHYFSINITNESKYVFFAQLEDVADIREAWIGEFNQIAAFSKTKVIHEGMVHDVWRSDFKLQPQGVGDIEYKLIVRR